jgi:putative ATP-dependent DNA ligase
MQDTTAEPGAAAAIDRQEIRAIVARARDCNRARPARLGRWQYLRFVHKFGTIPEGTAVFDDSAIWGYPKIGRILWLESGIKTHFEGAFWVEEKIDGYNVRIFRHGEDILALTRRGYICPFTTDRLTDLLNTRIFEIHPDVVLCAEVAGPENPYNEGSPPFISEDVQLFVFDMMYQGQAGFVPHRQKIQLLESYDLPGVPQFGLYRPADVESLRALLLRLDHDGREGILLKEDGPRDYRVKYVTGHINISDIRVSERGIKQLPPEFFMHRVLRLALFLEDQQIAATPSLCQELGEALITGIVDAARQYESHHKVFHVYRCRFRQRANAELLMRTMRRLLGKSLVEQHRLEREGEFYRLEFAKIMPRTTGLLGHIRGGGIIFD